MCVCIWSITGLKILKPVRTSEQINDGKGSCPHVPRLAFGSWRSGRHFCPAAFISALARNLSFRETRINMLLQTKPVPNIKQQTARRSNKTIHAPFLQNSSHCFKVFHWLSCVPVVDRTVRWGGIWVRFPQELVPQAPKSFRISHLPFKVVLSSTGSSGEFRWHRSAHQWWV